VRPGARRALPAVRHELERRRWLLIADARLPSIAAIVAREPISGSWWSHPLAHEIYDVCQWLDDQPEAARVKLVAGKVTFVHRSLFASIAAVGAAREVWQMRSLAPGAKRLLARCDARGVFRLDEFTPRTRDAAQARAKAALELERRLLVRTDELHTQTGAHVRRLWSWEAFRTSLAPVPDEIPAAAGRAALESAVAEFAAASGRRALLPWL
jgi:hypothetical protein